MTALYNDTDRGAVAWLAGLIAQGSITEGTIDDRPIQQLTADDLQHTRVHLFAGIGGWDYALKLAGWPDDRPVWTGSCPCQPFSSAGRRGGASDDRHLWPEMFRLIRECRPATVFGEQVASKAGRAWFAGVRADLESLGYAVGGADLCAAGVGAPHIRQRVYWVGHTDGPGPQGFAWAAQGASEGVSVASGPWSHYEPVYCMVGGRARQRRVRSGSFPLALGVSGRVAVRRAGLQGEEIHWYNRAAALRGLGNAIVPQVAAEFVKAYMETEQWTGTKVQLAQPPERRTGQ